MDIDYQKPTAELVFDLINRDNSDLPFPLTVDNCVLGKPQTFSQAGNFRNTRISVNPKPGSGYIGAFNVTYRRLLPMQLFPNGRAQLDDWSPNSTIPTSEWVVWLNQKYGLKLAPTDFSTTSFNAVVGSKTIAFAATCPAFTGTFYINRQRLERPVDTLIPEVTTNVGQLIAGVPAGPDNDNVADFITYGIDASRFADMFSAMSVTTKLTVTNSRHAELVDYMGMVAGESYNLALPATVRGGFDGCSMTRYALPNVNVPEANSTDYTHVVIIPAIANGWFVGRFLLHYRT